jgi:hypothetical protein
MEAIFTKAGVRILTPYDYDCFVANIDKPYLGTVFNVLFWSGMRYIEMKRFHSHPQWWMKERKAIHLPAEAQKKWKRTRIERYITPIPPQLEVELPYFFRNKAPPVRKVWNENMKRWAFKAGLDVTGISAKTTRASVESWMVAAGFPMNVICLRQGHDHITSMNHYQGLPFTEAEKIELKKRLYR